MYSSWTEETFSRNVEKCVLVICKTNWVWTNNVSNGLNSNQQWEQYLENNDILRKFKSYTLLCYPYHHTWTPHYVLLVVQRAGYRSQSYRLVHLWRHTLHQHLRTESHYLRESLCRLQLRSRWYLCQRNLRKHVVNIHNDIEVTLARRVIFGENIQTVSQEIRTKG